MSLVAVVLLGKDIVMLVTWFDLLVLSSLVLIRRLSLDGNHLGGLVVLTVVHNLWLVGLHLEHEVARDDVGKR